MKKEDFFHILSATLLFVIQYSFVSILPIPFSNLNLYIISLVFVLVLEGRGRAFFWAIVFGFLSGSFAFTSINVNLLIFPVLVLLADFLLINFFTNRSLYSYLIMSTSSILFYDVFFAFTSDLFYGGFSFDIFKFMAIYFSKEYLWVLSINIILVVIVFYIFNFVGQKFKPAFLVEQKEI